MKKKVQIMVEESMIEWTKMQAEEYGISISGLYNIAMAQYRQQQESANSIKSMPNIFQSMLSMMQNTDFKDIKEILEDKSLKGV